MDHPDVQLWPGFREGREEDVLIFLRYSYRFREHLEVRQDGLEADLSVQGQLHRTFVPWGAVALLKEEATGVQVLWPPTHEEPKKADPPEQPARARRGHLRLVESANED